MVILPTNILRFGVFAQPGPLTAQEHNKLPIGKNSRIVTCLCESPLGAKAICQNQVAAAINSGGDSPADLEPTLLNYLKLYKHRIPHRAIGAKTPIQALKEWQQKKPELFVKRVYDKTGLDA